MIINTIIINTYIYAGKICNFTSRIRPTYFTDNFDNIIRLSSSHWTKVSGARLGERPCPSRVQGHLIDDDMALNCELSDGPRIAATVEIDTQHIKFMFY